VKIGVLCIDMRIPGSRSLKDKRRVMTSLKEQLRSRFNCSVAETEFHDLWARAQLAVCVVSEESSHAQQQLNEILRFASNKPGAEILDYRIEMK
jgi:uncharacterized protein YlxP (DUF503 family)